MYGAIIGDIVGSKYEFSPIKSKDFPFISEGCDFTDDTVMTIAVAKALLESEGMQGHKDLASFKDELIANMQELGQRFPDRGYGCMFSSWLHSNDPHPYNSFGNGSAMRVSPCGLFATSLDEALELAKASAEVTHNHPEGIKGAQAVAACIFLAKSGKTKEEIGGYVCENFYDISESIDEIRPHYGFDETCQGSVPQAIECFLESSDYEDAVRNAISLGGDADTLAAITGSIAWTYYRLGHGSRENHVDRMLDAKLRHKLNRSCEHILERYNIDELLPSDFLETIRKFEMACSHY